MKAKVPAWIRSDQTLMIRLFTPNAAAYLTSFAIRISIAKLILHQDGHNYIFGLNIGDRKHRTLKRRPSRNKDILNNPHYSFTVDEGSLDVKMSVIK